MHTQSWVRKSHGTGTGFTTQQGFWIPVKPSAEELAQAAAREASARAAQQAQQPQNVAAKGRRQPVEPMEKSVEVRHACMAQPGTL